MFNKNKNKPTTNKVNKKNKRNNLPSINMISDGTKLKGTLNTKNDVRIAGKLEGGAKANGKLIITSTGKVDGDVKSADADIAGTLTGEIHVSNKLILRKSAVIDGDIYTQSLLVEEGAQINGACRMNKEGSKKISSKSKAASSDSNKAAAATNEKKG